MTDCTIDLTQTTKFLTTLDPQATTFCFQQIHDREDKALPVTHLPLADLSKLNRRNRNGYGNFVSINPVEFNERRTASNVIAVRAIYADDDKPRAKPRTDFPLEPSIIVESSKGKYHYYWILLSNGLDASIDHAEQLKKHIAERYQTDSAGVAGANRVLRLPGYIHNKNKDKPFRTTLISTTDSKYTISQLDEAFGFHYQASATNQPGNQSVIQSDTDLLDELEVLRETTEGEYHVICPWADSHTNTDDNRANFLLAGTGGHDSDQFHCHHDSCGKRDINDIHALAAERAIQYLPDGTQLELFKTKLPQIEPNEMFRTITEALQDEQEPHWVIEGLIEQNTVNIMYGDTGTFKSFLAIEKAACVASGHHYADDRYVEKGAAFYIASEGEGGINRRLRAHSKYHSYDYANNLFLSNVPARLGDTTYMATMAKTIKAMCRQTDSAPRLVIIDTLAASAGGLSTNSNDEMSELITLCNDLRRGIGNGVSFLLVHHTGHDGSRLRGASALKANMDASIRIEMTDGIICESVEKLKDGDTNTVLSFSTQEVELGVHSKTHKPYGSMVVVSADGSPGEMIARERGLNGRKGQALALLFELGGADAAAEPVDFDAWVDDVAQMFEDSGELDHRSARASATRCASELKDNKEVKVHKNRNGERVKIA